MSVQSLSDIMGYQVKIASPATSGAKASGLSGALKSVMVRLDNEQGSRAYEENLPRVALAKSKLTEKRMLASGFAPVAIAIPEPGQSRFTSWRHEAGYHAHDHGKAWVFHKDKHAPNVLDPIGTAKHMLTEGAPGAIGYMRHRMTGGAPLLDVMGYRGR